MLATPTKRGCAPTRCCWSAPGLIEAWPDLADRLFGDARTQPEAGAAERRIFWRCPGKGSAIRRGHDGRPQRRASCRRCSRRCGRASQAARPQGSPKPVAALATALQAARFGVAVWSRGEPRCAGDRDAGRPDRRSEREHALRGLPLAPGDNAHGVLQACGWMTGFPLRTGFGRGYPEHDPWRFDARRLVDAGEADCALWISAYRASRRPPGCATCRMIVLVDSRRRRTSASPSRSAAPASTTTRSCMTCATRHDRGARRAPAPSDAAVGRRRARADRRGACPRGPAVLTRITGGRVIDPANGRDGDRRRLDRRRPHRRRAGRRRGRRDLRRRPARSSWPAASTSTPTSPAAT